MFNTMSRIPPSDSVLPSTVVVSGDGSFAQLTTYTFTNLNLGTAAPGRLIVVAIIGLGRLGSTIASCTVDGNATTLVVVADDSGNDYAAFYAVEMDVGTSGDVVVTFSTSSPWNCVVALHAVYDLTVPSAAQATASDATMTAGVLDLDLNTTAASLTIGTAVSFEATGHVWSGLVEDANSNIGDNHYTTASGQTVAETPMDISVEITGFPTSQVACAATWH